MPKGAFSAGICSIQGFCSWTSVFEALKDNRMEPLVYLLLNNSLINWSLVSLTLRYYFLFPADRTRDSALSINAVSGKHTPINKVHRKFWVLQMHRRTYYIYFSNITAFCLLGQN